MDGKYVEIIGHKFRCIAKGPSFGLEVVIEKVSHDSMGTCWFHFDLAGESANREQDFRKHFIPIFP